MSPSKGSLADTAYQRIRRMIIRTDLVPGFRFTELGLANELGLGKTPVREALGRLVQDGLVDSLPRVGYRVTPITLRDVVKLFEFRLVVEPASARMASGRLAQDQEEELVDLISRELPDPELPDYLDVVTENNHRLHLTIARASGNDLLVRAVAETLEQGERLFRLVMADMVPKGDHQRLLECIIAGKSEDAAEVAYDHIAQVRDLILESYMSSQPVMDSELVLTPREERAE